MDASSVITGFRETWLVRLRVPSRSRTYGKPLTVLRRLRSVGKDAEMIIGTTIIRTRRAHEPADG